MSNWLAHRAAMFTGRLYPRPAHRRNIRRESYRIAMALRSRWKTHESFGSDDPRKCEEIMKTAPAITCVFVSVAFCSPTVGIVVPANSYGAIVSDPTGLDASERRQTSSWSGPRWKIGIAWTRRLRGGRAHAGGIFRPGWDRSPGLSSSVSCSPNRNLFPR